jgi:putative molybdopterin biosynthesis protein
MAEYLTTREVARYLKLNEKKVYALVSAGRLPAAKLSGKWLFPKDLIDQWVESKTIFPVSGLMSALLGEMIVIQGSDDWLFSRITQAYQSARNIPVASAKVGSLAGLTAVSEGKAHLAGCHVENQQVESLMAGRHGCYLINLLQRTQGLIFDRNRHPKLERLEDVSKGGLRFAQRQELSGTYRLMERLLSEHGLSPRDIRCVGPYSTHLELAAAVRAGDADCGMGIQVAANLLSLDFMPLATEPYKLAVPTAFISHPQINDFLEFVLDELREASRRGTPGYRFDDIGRMEVIPRRGDESRSTS